MKLNKLVLIIILFSMILGGCRTRSTIDDDKIETTEFLPFYGEVRFLIVFEDSSKPIPGAGLQISNLHIEEDEDSIRSGQDGSIVIHQINSLDRYFGKGPPLPTFTFSAPNYHAKTFSVKDLVSGTSYDPYRSDSLPTTTFNYKGKSSYYRFKNLLFVLYQLIDSRLLSSV